MILSQAERNSAVWQKLKTHCEDKLNRLRIRNDGEMSEFKRAKLCGHIEAVKSLLSIGSDQPAAENEDELFE